MLSMFGAKKKLIETRANLVHDFFIISEETKTDLREIKKEIRKNNDKIQVLMELVSKLENNCSNKSAKTKEGARVSLDSVLDIIKKNAGKNGITSNQVVEILQDRGMTESFEILQGRVCSTIFSLRKRGSVVQINNSTVRKVYKAV